MPLARVAVHARSEDPNDLYKYLSLVNVSVDQSYHLPDAGCRLRQEAMPLRRSLTRRPWRRPSLLCSWLLWLWLWRGSPDLGERNLASIRWIYVRKYISWEDSLGRNLGSFVVQGSELQRFVIFKNNQGTINAIKAWCAGKHA